jgi:hypothetical protein
MWQIATSAPLTTGWRAASIGPKSWPDRPDAAASALAWSHSAVCSNTSPVATSVNVRGGVVVVVVGAVVVVDASDLDDTGSRPAAADGSGAP